MHINNLTHAKQFDLERHDMAICPHSYHPLRIETKTEIFQQYRRGEPVEALAQRFCRTCTSIYRIVKEMRASRIMELPLDSIGNEQFARLRRSRRNVRSCGRCRKAICRRRSRECPMACPHIWPVCTRCPY